MRAFFETIFRIGYTVVPVGGAIYGMAAHESYGMGLAICGIIGGVLGLITAALLHLVSIVILSGFCSDKRFRPKR
jgi:tetrahydromethanopterin S-methyltransferase subunit D